MTRMSEENTECSANYSGLCTMQSLYHYSLAEPSWLLAKFLVKNFNTYLCDDRPQSQKKVPLCCNIILLLNAYSMCTSCWSRYRDLIICCQRFDLFVCLFYSIIHTFLWPSRKWSLCFQEMFEYIFNLKKKTRGLLYSLPQNCIITTGLQDVFHRQWRGGTSVMYACNI